MAEREFHLTFTGRIDPDAVPELEEGDIRLHEAEYAYRVLGYLARDGWESVRLQYIGTEAPDLDSDPLDPDSSPTATQSAERRQEAPHYHPHFVTFYPAEEPGEEVAVIDIGGMQAFGRATEKSAQMPSSIINDLYAAISPWIKRLRGENFVPHRVERFLHIIDKPNTPGQLHIAGFKADLIHELVQELELGTLEVQHFGVKKQVYLRQLAAAAVQNARPEP